MTFHLLSPAKYQQLLAIGAINFALMSPQRSEVSLSSRSLLSRMREIELDISGKGLLHLINEGKDQIVLNADEKAALENKGEKLNGAVVEYLVHGDTLVVSITYLSVYDDKFDRSVAGHVY